MPEEDYAPSRYHADNEHLEAILGALEAKVMNAVWGMKPPVPVREVYEKLRREKKIAYTTVMTTMNSLHEKGLLDRKVTKGRGGLHYIYWPRCTRQEVERSTVKQVIDSLIRNFGDSVATYLVEMATSDDGFRKIMESRSVKGK